MPLWLQHFDGLLEAVDRAIEQIGYPHLFKNILWSKSGQEKILYLITYHIVLKLMSRRLANFGGIHEAATRYISSS